MATPWLRIMEMSDHPQAWMLLLLASESSLQPRCYRTQRAYAFSRAVIPRGFVAMMAMRGQIQYRSISRRLRKNWRALGSGEQLYNCSGTGLLDAEVRVCLAPEYPKQARSFQGLDVIAQ
jgi:hypothetical protein